jgi:hypothetical protein
MTEPEDAPRQTHEGITLRLSDLADEQGVIRNHDFLSCEIRGPAFVMFSGVLHDNYIDGFPDECFYDVGAERERYVGAIIVYRCGFESCTFLNVGFTGRSDHLNDFKSTFAPL